MEKISIFLKQFGVWIGIGVVGVGMLVYGVSDVLIPGESTVEIVHDGEVQSTNSVDGEQVKVDVSGAVQIPGVYAVPHSSRIGDVLVTAGGLSSEADRNWVAQTLNLAEPVKDGEKLYIPTKTTQTGTEAGKINVNTASVGELDALPGIGEARAQAIIASRPYKNTDEVVSKAKIPQSVYDKIKEQISVY